MNDLRRDLAAYYEAEAQAGTRTEVSGRRVVFRDRFVEQLLAEGRRSVVEFGSGPGLDAPAFVDAGLSYVGVDLAAGNAAIARRNGLTVVPASLFDPPFPPNVFDAAWSISTLMHVPGAEFDQAMEAVLLPLRAGAPFAIGMWGGAMGDVTSYSGPAGERRFFSLRSADRNTELLSRHGRLEHFETWTDAGPDDWEYHAAILRLPDE